MEFFENQVGRFDNLVNAVRDRWVEYTCKRLLRFVRGSLEVMTMKMSIHHQEFVRERLLKPSVAWDAIDWDTYLDDCDTLLKDMHDLLDIDI